MFFIEVLVKEDRTRVWKKVKPTGGLPYEFLTHDHAYRAMEMWYPAGTGRVLGKDVRIVKEG